MHSAKQIWVEIKAGGAGRSGATAKLHAADIGANLFDPSGSRPAAAHFVENLARCAASRCGLLRVDRLAGSANSMRQPDLIKL